jgi:predicted Fe-Mo cluster-binding NifX family protein
MIVCIPTQEDNGTKSIAYGHFGSASYFIICDTENNDLKTISNRDQEHVHGACNPIAALSGHSIEVVIVGGIGNRAVMSLNNSGIKVFQSPSGTVNDCILALKAGKLNELTPANACGGHAGGCAH